jgi:MFS family permease
VLHEVKGLDLALASAALTAYMAGSGGGVLLGGWAADKSTRYLAFFVAGLTSFSAVAILVVNLVPMGAIATIGLMLLSGVGARRQPDAARRDAEGRRAARADRQGASASSAPALPLGSAVTPVPLRLSDRPWPCRARADRGGGVSAGEPALHGQRKGLGQASRHRGGGRVIRLGGRPMTRRMSCCAFGVFPSLKGHLIR